MTTTFPESMEGVHIEHLDEVVDLVRDVLTREAGLPPNQSFHYRNAGDIRCYEDSADQKLCVLVPLPFLTDASVTTDELERGLAMAAPTFVQIEVDVAPPP